MKSPYKSPENLVAEALFSSVFLATLGFAVLGISIWTIATERADVTIIGMIAVVLTYLAVSLYFFGEYRREKRERAERQAEKEIDSQQRG